MPMGEHAGLAIAALIFLAIALLGLATRLTGGPERARPGGNPAAGTGPTRPGRPRPGRAGVKRRDRTPNEDFGLLRVAALTEDRDGAEVVRALLAGAGIRATIARTPEGWVRVLVFADDLERARAVVSGPPSTA